MTRRLFDALGGLCLMGVLVGCSSEGAAGVERPEGGGVSLPVADGAVPTTGCVASVKVGDGNGCRGEWTCAGPVHRTLLCVATDGGFICVCSAGADSETNDAGAPKRAPDSCASADDVPHVAGAICGWTVP